MRLSLVCFEVVLEFSIDSRDLNIQVKTELVFVVSNCEIREGLLGVLRNSPWMFWVWGLILAIYQSGTEVKPVGGEE